MLFTALAKCLPGLVMKISISLFSTAEAKKSSGPNEALAELQGVRLAYAEEPSQGCAAAWRAHVSDAPSARATPVP